MQHSIVALLVMSATAFTVPPSTGLASQRMVTRREAVIPGDSVAEAIVINGSLNFFSIYNTVVTARILLSWFPQSMGVPLLQPIFIVTEPFLGLFRGLIPPIGGIDLSIIPALLLLNAAGGAVSALGADPSFLQH